MKISLQEEEEEVKEGVVGKGIRWQLFLPLFLFFVLLLQIILHFCIYSQLN